VCLVTSACWAPTNAEVPLSYKSSILQDLLGEIPREGRSMHPKAKQVHKYRGRGMHNKGGYYRTVLGRTIKFATVMYNEGRRCELTKAQSEIRHKVQGTKYIVLPKCV
jgi:hypothetical protein